MHRKHFKVLLIVVLFSLFISLPAWSQIEDNLKRYTGSNAEGYMKPIVNGLAANMNRGWYQSAKIPTMGLRLRVGLVAMIAPIPDDDKTFTATTEGSFNPAQEAQASTVVGSEEAVMVTGTGGSVYAFPGGLNMNATAFAVPQVTVGLMGSEAIVRFFKADLGDSDLGSLQVLGLGIRHSISQYLFMFPIDISAGFFWQDISVDEDLLKMNAIHYGVQASKGFGLLTLYGGLGFDSGSAKLKYNFQDVNTNTQLPVEMDINGDSGMEITAGLGLNMALLHLTADATFGNRTAFALGLALGL